MDTEIISRVEIVNTDKTLTSKHKNIKKIGLQFYIYCLGCLLIQGATMSVSSLLSSINIRQNIGTKTLAATKLSSTVAGLFCTPILIRKLGYKWALVVGEIITVLYIAANIYPTTYVMITAGILYGIGSSLVWTLMPVYLLLFGKLHANHGSNEYNVYSRKYTAQFYAIIRSGRILASAVSYAVLYGTKEDVENDLPLNGTQITNISLDVLEENNFEYCGANDCQNPNITIKTLNKYVPPNPLSIYLLIGIYSAIAVCAVVLHSMFLTNLSVDDDSLNNKNQSDQLNGAEKEKPNVKKLSFMATMKSTMKHAASLKQFLLFPFLIYHGLYMGFVYSEMNRSFSSCILGVEMVGIVLISHDVLNVFGSLVSGKLIEFFGRNPVIVFAASIDLSIYLFCEFWKPTEDTKILVYVIYAAYGISDALWKNCIIAIYSDYFQQNLEISFSVKYVATAMGVAIGYLWSPLFCVSVKLYIQIGMLSLSMLGYGAAECCTKDTTGASALIKDTKDEP